jgi:hypothetical protein
LNDLFHGEDLLDDPEPEENDDWVASMTDDRPMNAVCDDVFGECDNTWSQDPVGWRGPRAEGAGCAAAVSLRHPRAVQVGHANARRPEAALIRNARRERVGRRPLLCRSSVVWLAACLMLGAFCFGWSAWSSSVSNLPKAHAAAHSATPASSPVTYVTKNIEDVRKGETVVAWDPVTGELGRHEVTNTFERTSDHLRVLEFALEGDDDLTQTLETTDEHPFWSVEAGDFVAAGDLRPGDRFISPAGEFSTLVATHRDEHPEGVAVYNFEVADVHNYYVRAHGLRGPPIRVHNAQGYSWTTGRRNTWKNLASLEAENPTGKFSTRNLLRMADGNAPRMRVKMQNRNTGQVVTRDVSLELHHRYLPQRSGSKLASEPWNLEPATPWAHEGMDRYRSVGWDLLKIIMGPNSY